MKSKKKIGSFFPVRNKTPKCVLIYDDDQEILLLCKIILERYYHVETRMKCENIISDISQIKPDIILMDLWIPAIGGEKAIALKKNDPVTQFVPVILFSANDEIDKICIKTGANGYISKPFDIDTLKEVIEKNIL
ncbi:MAG TPA: response regulator [Hanamia sp.]